MKAPAISTTLQRVFLSAIAASSLFSASQSFGQVNGPGPSAPSLFDNVINVPIDQATFGNSELIGGVDGETTQFNLSVGGSVGALFGALSGAEVNISGGTVGDPLNPELESLRAFIGSELNVSGGAIGENMIVRGATFNLSGGTIGDDLSLERDGVINITGGEIGFGTIADSVTINVSGGKIGGFFQTLNGILTISGGEMGDNFLARSQSTVDISGGTFGARFEATGTGTISGGQFGLGAEVGGTVAVSDGEFGNELFVGSDVIISGGTFGTSVRGSEFELRGSEFKLNGIPFGNTTLTIDSFIAQNDGDVFTGVLEDGSSFIIAALSRDSFRNVVITNVPVPTPDLNPIVVNTPFPNLPSGLRAGQSLTVQGGGLLGNNFEIVDATLNVEGGTIGNQFGMSRSTVNLSGGTIGDGFHSNRGSIINIDGGAIGDDFRTHLGSVVTLTAGAIGENFRPQAGSEFHMSGGSIGQGFQPQNGQFADSPIVRISGGTVGRGFSAFTEDFELSGGEFQLNGADYSAATINVSFGDVFTGTLSDGSAFIFAGLIGDSINNLTLNRTALPDIDTAPIIVDASTTNGLTSLRSGQTLTLELGGVIDREFEAIGAVININGGSFTDATAFSNTTVNLSDGSIAANAQAFDGSVFNVDGGTIGDQFSANEGSVVNITDGVIGDSFNARSGSEVFISGGSFGESFDSNQSTVEISGGTFGRRFQVGSNTELSGGEFKLNGVDYDEATIRLNSLSSDVFSGTLSDGSTFIIAGRLFDELLNVQLNRTALPVIDTTPIVVSSSTPVIPTGIRAGQTLTLEEGGAIDGAFEAVGGVININGGSFAGGTAFSNATVTLNEGSILDFAIFSRSIVNINDGVLGNTTMFGLRPLVTAGSEVNLFGGTVGGISADSGSVINIHGDVFEPNGANDRSRFFAQFGSTVNFFATQFFIDGEEVEFTDLDTPLLISDRGISLSGVFPDGSEFDYTVNSNAFGDLGVDQGANLQLNLVDADPALRGDVNLDSTVNFLDIAPFVSILSTGDFQAEADIDASGEVNFLDITPFVQILSTQ